MSKKRALLFLQIGFYIAVIWFVIQKFNHLTASLDRGSLFDRPLLIVLSALCFVFFYCLLSVHWKLLCDKYVKFPQHHQWLSFFASQPYKYLPSSVFTFSSRAVYAKKLGLPLKQSSAIQLIENFDLLLSGLGVSLLFLIYHMSMTAGIAVTAAGLLGLGIIAIIPAVQIPKTAITISGREWVRLFTIPVLGWIGTGTAFYLLVLATGQHLDFVSAVAANALAVSLGILAIFAPGGIGVREFVYNKFKVANPGIILWRLLTLIVDIVVGTIAIYWIRSLQKKTG